MDGNPIAWEDAEHLFIFLTDHELDVLDDFYRILKREERADKQFAMKIQMLKGCDILLDILVDDINRWANATISRNEFQMPRREDDVCAQIYFHGVNIGLGPAFVEFCLYSFRFGVRFCINPDQRLKNKARFMRNHFSVFSHYRFTSFFARQISWFQNPFSEFYFSIPFSKKKFLYEMWYDCAMWPFPKAYFFYYYSPGFYRYKNINDASWFAFRYRYMYLLNQRCFWFKKLNPYSQYLYRVNEYTRVFRFFRNNPFTG